MAGGALETSRPAGATRGILQERTGAVPVPVGASARRVAFSEGSGEEAGGRPPVPTVGRGAARDGSGLDKGERERVPRSLTKHPR